MVSFLRCHIIVTLLLVVLLPATALGDEEASTPAFEDVEQYRVDSENGVVSADEPLASEIGAALLEAGGNAADAGVAAMLTLNVTNPVSSGLGGGGFCLYRDADTAETTVLDFRETAPAEAHRDLYAVDGEVDHDLARRGGLAIATPGEPGGLWALHGRFGALHWEDVVEPAQQLAEEGHAVTAPLANHLDNIADDLDESPELREVFSDDDGELLQEGDLLVRSDLAKTLSILAEQGVRPFYVGEIADAIAESAQKHGGILSTDDLASYAVKPRDPVVTEFKDYQIHSMPPPSSGGIALAQAFNILSHLDAEPAHGDAAYLHFVVEALKHAFADRAHWLGDSDFVEIPTEKLLSDDYARELASRIDPEGVLDTYEYGTTPPDHEEAGTAHVSIIDGDDHMLSCTTTINTRFGSMVLVPEYGLVLNNEMADFNVEVGEPNIFGLIGNEQNKVEANKRPLSSMSPTLIVEGERPLMALGASGGPMIITGVYFSILDILVHGIDALEAVTAPRIHHQWIPEELFVETAGLAFADELSQLGHTVKPRRIFSAVQLVLRRGDTWIGVTDPRKGGVPAAPQSRPDSE